MRFETVLLTETPAQATTIAAIDATTLDMTIAILAATDHSCTVMLENPQGRAGG
jgi:hypothetical protein